MLHKLQQFNDCEISLMEKADSQPEGFFKGYASKFGGVDSYGDRIDPHAYDATLKNRKRMFSGFINHDSFDIPVLDWIKAEVDSKGLLVEGVVDFNHHKGPALYSAMKRKAMDGLSIGYRIPKNGAEELEDGTRLLKKIELIEVSVVTRPADDKARISNVKAEIDTLVKLRDFEVFLRESGAFSKNMATAFVGQLKQVILSESENLLQAQRKSNQVLQEFEAMVKQDTSELAAAIRAAIV